MFFKQLSSLVLVLTFAVGIVFQTATICSFYLFEKETAKVNCINKNKPELKCNGQCQLTKKLTKAEPVEKASEINESSFWLFAVEELKTISFCHLQELTVKNDCLKLFFSEQHLLKIEFPPDFI